MGTTGGDRHQLLKDTKNAFVYAVIAPQMGKQVWKLQCIECIQLSPVRNNIALYTIHHW